MSHSIYSFSSSHRWIEGACPASVKKSRGYPNISNPAAELGTAVHALGEFCIRLGINPNDCIDLTFENHKVNHKMADDASMYFNVINDLSLRYGVKPILEGKVAITSVAGGKVYGTSDCNFIVLPQRIVHIIDYKNGYMPVEIVGHSQTSGYGVATLDTYDLWDKVDTVVNTVIQPNGNHIEGPVRTTIQTIGQMREWRDKFGRSVELAESNTKPVAGEHCTYCPAQANCRARMEYTLQSAYINCAPEDLSLGEVEAIYREIGSVKVFHAKIEARMLEEARKGEIFKDYKLVKSYPRAKCENVEGLLAEAKIRGIDPLKFYLDPNLIGITRAKKLLPEDIVKQFYKSPPPGTALVGMKHSQPAIRVGKATGFTPIGRIDTPSLAGVFTKI
jgi:hypothetical protein